MTVDNVFRNITISKKNNNNNNNNSLSFDSKYSYLLEFYYDLEKLDRLNSRKRTHRREKKDCV